jgi:hypothetical protein
MMIGSGALGCARVPGVLGCVELGGQGGAKLLSSDQPLQLLTRRDRVLKQSASGCPVGLTLSRLDSVQGLEDKLDDAVALQLGHADQLADGCQNYPESWMREKFHGYGCGCASSLDTRFLWVYPAGAAVMRCRF